MSDEREPTEPELELGTLDPADQHALDELDQSLADQEQPAHSDSGPVPRPAPAADARAAGGGWASFFPPETLEQSRDFLGQLAPSVMPPAPQSTASGLLDVSSLTSSADVSGVKPLPSSPPAGAEPSQDETADGGLISSILGQAAGALGDEGALAALRTLPRRAASELRDTAFADEQEMPEARIELLKHLAENSRGAVRARLHCAIAELHARRGARDLAFASYEAAYAAKPDDRLVLRRLRRERLARGQVAQAAELFRAEAKQASDVRERCLLLCAASELDASAAEPGTFDYATVRGASEADPNSLLARLLLAQRALAAGNKVEAAAALRSAATSVPNGPSRALLLLEAGRMLEQSGNAAGALTCCNEACTADPQSLGALLGAARLRMTSGDSTGAAHALGTLAAVCDDARLRAELTRQRAQLLLHALGDPKSAVEALRAANTEPAVRLLTRAAETASDLAEHVRALDAWANMAGAAERGVALVELAALHARQELGSAAMQAFQQATAARAPAALLGMVRDTLLRNHGDTSLLDGFVSQSAENALRAAAKLVRDPQRTAHELEALGKLPDDGSLVTADILRFDAAAEQGDAAQLQAALARDATRWPKAARVGPLLAALDLQGPDATPEHAEHVRQLAELSEGQPAVTRYLAAQASTPEACAELWLAEADACSGEQAAFASATAGRYLQLANKDATEAYADALDAVRGHAAGAFGLELTARASADLTALERVHRELASTTESPHERAARRVRMGLLSADSDIEEALRWLELAAEDRPDDAVLEELTARLAADQSPLSLAQRLHKSVALENSPGFARALTLRAAAAYERAGQWDEALRAYRNLLEQTPDDTHADLALLSALRRSGRLSELATELERRLQLTEDTQRWTPLLEDRALVEQARADSGRARMVYETLLDRDPRHVPALRALQRNAMLDRDDVRLANVSLRLFEALDQPTEQSGELQLGMRFANLVGPDGAKALLRAEGRVKELWYALNAEALALESGDRTRSYEALRTVSAVLRVPLERAAYALRAAEVMESAGPELALSELADTLLAVPEHPLALEQAARLYKAAGQPRPAAENFERAGLAAVSLTRGAPLFYTAAVLFQDELGEPERAIANLTRVAQNDVLFADSFARLRDLLRAAQRSHELQALIETRLAAPIEPAIAAQLELERCALARQLGDHASAKKALLAAVKFDAAHPALWRELADLHVADGEYRAAAEALVQLARLADNDQALADAFFRLGMLYDQQLPDPKRAEIAFTRVIALTPDDPRPAERLALLFKRQGRPDEALRTLNHLIDNAASSNKREEYVALRALTMHDLGQTQAAEQALDEARRLSPASMTVLRAQSSLYQRQGDKTALQLHLQRSCNTLRGAIELDPGEITHWLGLCELLVARDRQDGVALVASMAHALGLSHPTLPAVPISALGRDGVRDVVQRRVSARGPLDPLRALLRDHARAIDPCLPFDGPADPEEFAETARAAAQVADLFGLPSLRVLASPQAQCLPYSDEPLAICVDRATLLLASDAERVFLLARAVAVAKAGCTLLVRAVPERVLLVLHALWTVADSTHTAAVLDAKEQQRVTRQLAAAIPASDRPLVKSLVTELMGYDDINPRRLAAAALDLGSRLALMATGDVAAALNALLWLRGRAPAELMLADKLELCRTDSSVRALLSFAISEVYLETRREFASSAGQEPD